MSMLKSLSHKIELLSEITYLLSDLTSPKELKRLFIGLPKDIKNYLLGDLERNIKDIEINIKDLERSIQLEAALNKCFKEYGFIKREIVKEEIVGSDELEEIVKKHSKKSKYKI